MTMSRLLAPNWFVHRTTIRLTLVGQAFQPDQSFFAENRRQLKAVVRCARVGWDDRLVDPGAEIEPSVRPLAGWKA